MLKKLYAQTINMNRIVIKLLFKILLYRKAMNIIECKIIGNDNLFPVCPRCECTLDREYQSFCDRCGQKLKWKKYYNGKVSVKYKTT